MRRFGYGAFQWKQGKGPKESTASSKAEAKDIPMEEARREHSGVEDDQSGSAPSLVNRTEAVLAHNKVQRGETESLERRLTSQVSRDRRITKNQPENT